MRLKNFTFDVKKITSIPSGNTIVYETDAVMIPGDNEIKIFQGMMLEHSGSDSKHYKLVANKDTTKDSLLVSGKLSLTGSLSANHVNSEDSKMNLHTVTILKSNFEG